jgi:micrococcal nuclease
MPIRAAISKPKSISVRPYGGLRRGVAVLLLLAFASSYASAVSASEVLVGKVTQVFDGDSVAVLLSSGRIRVRLHGIDAPERGQPHAAAARAWLRQQILQQEIRIEPISQDQYDRVVAQVHLGERNINQELVAEGYAWAYRHYMRRADRPLCALEAAARTARRGLWSDKAPHAPWEHRASKGMGPFTSYAVSSEADCRKAQGR